MISRVLPSFMISAFQLKPGQPIRRKIMASDWQLNLSSKRLMTLFQLARLIFMHKLKNFSSNFGIKLSGIIGNLKEIYFKPIEKNDHFFVLTSISESLSYLHPFKWIWIVIIYDLKTGTRVFYSDMNTERRTRLSKFQKLEHSAYANLSVNMHSLITMS